MAITPLPEQLAALIHQPAATSAAGADVPTPATHQPLQTEDGGAWPQLPEPDREPQTGRMDTFFVS